MPSILLYELAPTRSARCRWTLLEADLEFESIGGSPEIIGIDPLRKVDPLGKLPAALIDGRPLYESAAICTAIADLVPDRDLIAKPGSWSRALHDQWVSFALTEMEAWLWSSELNSSELILPEEQRVPEILDQNRGFFLKNAAVMDTALAEWDFLVDERFTVTDIIVGYTVRWAEEDGLLDGFSNLTAYLDRLCERAHCPLRRACDWSLRENLYALQ